MLSESHRHMLTKESGISDEVINARGYRTVTTKSDLCSFGFTRPQARVPALLIPILNVHGEIANYHIRPESPRVVDGKVRKYEFPPKSRMALDVPPTIRHLVADPNIPLWVTEGTKKGDSLASRGCCAVALIGVWCWRWTNEHGGKTALPDWELVALNGRTVYVVFDSDVMTKREVYQALERLRALLQSRDAHVLLVYLPSGEGGRKVGVDDFLASGKTVDDLIGLATSHLQRPPQQEEEEHSIPYKAREHGLVWLKHTQHGATEVSLTNFNAQITADVEEDDGVETRRRFEIEASLNGSVSRFTVPNSQFAAMNWPTEHLGARAIVYPGMGLKDHARAAIQFQSTNIQTRRTYTHTGWTRLDTGEWVYLHAGGAIGQVGQVPGVEVVLPHDVARYTLPGPPQGGNRVNAIRASMRMLGAAPDRISIPMYSAIWRATLGESPLSLWLTGRTGLYKTAVAALAQQHYGAGLDATHLPGAWSGTANALEGLAFTLKDALVTVDDFCPTGSISEVQRLNAYADRLLRAQANQAGRQRMRRDTTLQATKHPRGLILSTGEDVPKGASLQARVLILEVGPHDVNLKVLSQCQQEAAEGLYAQAMSGFLQWLASNYETWQSRLTAEVDRYRQQAMQAGMHRRTPEMVAHLALGFDVFLEYAQESGALSKAEADALWVRAWDALKEAASTQHQHQVESDPVRRALKLLASSLASGRAHVASAKLFEPTDPQVWGWRLKRVGDEHQWHPQGKGIGWIDGENLYLDPDAAYATVQTFAREANDPLLVSAPTLWKRFRERGLLLSRDQTRQTNTVRMTLQGARRSVLHLHTDSLQPEEPPPIEIPDQPDQPTRKLG